MMSRIRTNVVALLAAARSGLAAPPLILLIVIAAAFVWAYWTTLEELAGSWGQDPEYSHGYLVPILAVVIVWLRRRPYASQPMHPSWWGVPLILAGSALRLGGAYLYFFWPDRISLIPVLAGVCVAVGGWRALRWTWPGIAFLLFMLPLPSHLHGMLAYPLQRAATESTTYLLQTMGLSAQAEGNVILLSEVEMGVVEACSGLRMLVAFFAVATAIVLVLRPPVWQAVVIVVSALPIAIIANVARLTLTGVLHETVGSDVAQAVFHDWGGWLMMPLASVLLYLELVLLSRLITVAPAPDASTLVRMALGRAEQAASNSVNGSRPLATAGRGTSPKAS